LRREPNRARSLEDLERDDWGDPKPDDTGLVARCLAARRVPIGALSIEQLRMLIGQRIGLAYLVVIAIEAVERDPFVSGDLYPGDLLSALSVLPREAWTAMPELRERLRVALARAADADATPTDEALDREPLRRTLSQCARAFAANA
jgi:hypothetical protein